MKSLMPERVNDNQFKSEEPNSNKNYYDWYNTGVKNEEQLKQMRPVDQLAYLSSMIEAAESDSAYAYFEAYSIFKNVEKSEDYSPLIRAVAEVGRKLDVNSEDYDYEASLTIAEDKFGYSSVVFPISLWTTEKDLDETEIRLRLKRIDDKLVNMGRVSSTDPDFLDSVSVKNELEGLLKMAIFEKNQAKLHEEFPSLPKDKQLVKIASDAVATVEFQVKYDVDEAINPFSVSLGQIINKNGNSIDLDREMNELISAIHRNNYLKGVIEKKIGLSLDEMPLEAEARLLKFMTKANNKRFERLCNTTNGINDKRLCNALVENFVAVDFGEDFGDALLDIVNSKRITSEQVESILNSIGSCRESIEGITGLYKGFDGGKFAHDYAYAANERLTDIIIVFREIAQNGRARADLRRMGITELDYDTAMEALKYEADSLSIINGTMSDVISGQDGVFAEKFLSPDAQHNRSMYNLYSPNFGYVMLYTRPEGSSSFDSSIEYGKNRSRYDEVGNNVGIEASISMITDPIDPFKLPNPFRPNRHSVQNMNYYDESTMNKVSAIRIDREGRTADMSYDDQNRSPISENGLASVDLAAVGDRTDTPSGKIARLISLGNQIRADRVNKERVSLNHNIIGKGSEDNYGSAEEFKKIVEYVNNAVGALCAIYPPSKNEGLTGAERAEKQRKRARKALYRAA